MKKVIVKVTTKPVREYTIHIGEGAIDGIGSLYDFKRHSKAFVITDAVIEPLLLDRVVRALPLETASVVLPAGEKHKTVETVQQIWQAMRAAGCDRQTVVVNLGGGVIGDIGGFAASTYMRGVTFINVPTSLLAQVDASVGGKTGFNFAGIKNLIGTFDQPSGIIIDPGILRALPERDFTAGFAEVIKQGLIMDRQYFEQVTAKRPRDFTTSELTAIIARSCRLKADIIERDPDEQGERKLLNFGHTVGHAVEAYSLQGDGPLLHGEAVSIGMVAETTIAQGLGLLSAEDATVVRERLAAFGLPTAFSDGQAAALLRTMGADKKNAGGEVRFSLIDGIGHALYDQTAPPAVIADGLRAIGIDP